MKQVISIGNQNFISFRKHDYFYIYKTSFIKEWWESTDVVTLVTRPRRFGKTLNLSIIESFFFFLFKCRSDLFKGLSIWKEEKYQKLQGTYPVIFLSFAEIKNTNFKDARKGIIDTILECYQTYIKLWKETASTEKEKYCLVSLSKHAENFTLEKPVVDTLVTKALKRLCYYLNCYYNKKVIILLDEYDIPLQEAYVDGYWKEMVSFLRNLFNSTFKTNTFMERSLMTGITRVSKESIFSDLNNLVVVTTTSERFATSFGFTEKEVFHALDQQELSSYKEKVKEWYDGFQFGSHTDIYNP